MACKARWVALLLACLLPSSALAQRSSSGGMREPAGGSRSSATFRATPPPPPPRSTSSGGSSNSGGSAFGPTLRSVGSTETSNSGGSSFGTLSRGSSISSLSYGSDSRGGSSQSSGSAFPGGGTSTSSQYGSGSRSGTDSSSRGSSSQSSASEFPGGGISTSSSSGSESGTGSSSRGSSSPTSASEFPGGGTSPSPQASSASPSGTTSPGSSSGASSSIRTSSTNTSPPLTATRTSAATADTSPPLVGEVTSVSGGCGAGGATNCAGGNSDPVMYGFAGRAFNFMGEPGKIYNIISTLNIQVSMKLKLAQVWDHNGTNMEAIGFMYRNYKVLVSLDAKEDVVVTAQGRTLKVKNTAKHYAWRFDDGAYIQTTWERYKPGLGNTVTIETDVIKMTIWQTPAGIVDEGGVVLGAWLNFGLSLEAPPANGLMHGIVGETYDRFIMGETAVSDPKSQLYLPADGAFHGRYKDEGYEMADHWDTNFPANLFGVTDPGFQQQGRSSLEDDTNQSAFPAFARACFLCDQTPSGQSHTF